MTDIENTVRLSEQPNTIIVIGLFLLSYRATAYLQRQSGLKMVSNYFLWVRYVLYSLWFQIKFGKCELIRVNTKPLRRTKSNDLTSCTYFRTPFATINTRTRTLNRGILSTYCTRLVTGMRINQQAPSPQRNDRSIAPIYNNSLYHP